MAGHGRRRHAGATVGQCRAGFGTGTGTGSRRCGAARFSAERKAIGDSRAWTKYRFATAERACYDKFFVTPCIDKAKEVQRQELQVLRQRELEVGEAERAQRAADRDREQALRQAEFEASQPQRSANERASRESFEKKQQEQQLRDAQHQADAPKRSANAQSYQQKQADFDARMREAQKKAPNRPASTRKT